MATYGTRNGGTPRGSGKRNGKARVGAWVVNTSRGFDKKKTKKQIFSQVVYSTEQKAFTIESGVRNGRKVNDEWSRLMQYCFQRL
jgi:hypothetical protein